MAAAVMKEGDLLWSPSVARIDNVNLTHFMAWLRGRGRHFDSYGDLGQWSVDDQDGFWGSPWEYFGVRASNPYKQVLAARAMPGADWFPGTQLNYAEHALRHERQDADALVFLSERDAPRTLSWSDHVSGMRNDPAADIAGDKP
jgi:acetoacetyl-CoA synthetase